ncbi:MAG TPA: DUF1684 domain-containing protein [Ktedonobacterales bacterium]|nr:DUF1684 domain-containing protein [Ktedonobacterales bacterium]
MEQLWQRTPTWLDLADWRKRVAAMYAARDAALTAGGDPQTLWENWRATRDDLFARHPQSPLSDVAQRAITQLHYFPYNPAWRVTAQVEPIADDVDKFDGVAPVGMRFRHAARLHFTLMDTPPEAGRSGASGAEPVTLTLYWIDVYGGGLFLPFRDASGADESYGGGRYLCDTVKGSTLWSPDDAGQTVVLDFNYAYNPSCAYDERWLCPLAPTENRVAAPIRAGELRFHP